MNSTELYKLWAPESATWSNWVKPVLLAHRPLAAAFYSAPDWRGMNMNWSPSADSGSAIILDLPSADSVWLGLALALRGFRPVPLFNGASGPSEIVSSHRIISALHDSAKELAGLTIGPGAPPVFLLDSNRSGGGALTSPGRFDNRWFVFPQDFPSANFLLSCGIRSVVLGQVNSVEPQRDLAHVLLRWQEAGIEILGCDLQRETPPSLIRVKRPGNFQMLWYRALVIMGLRRNSVGGFGEVIPMPSQSSG